MKTAICSRLAVVAGIVAFPVNASALLIDDFTQGGVLLVDPLGAGSVEDIATGLDPSHAIATARRITFNAIDVFTPGDTGEVRVQVDPSDGGVLRHSPDPGLAAANFFVSYGSTRLGLPPMSLNLLADGANRLTFDFDVVIPDPGGVIAMDVLLVSGNGTFFGTFISVPTSNSPITIEIPFNDIIGQTPTFDLTDVTEIEFGTSNGTIMGNVEISRIHTIPEPASLLLVAFGLVLCSAQHRNRKKGR